MYSSTAEGIFTVLNGKLVELLDCANPWDFCTSVGVDNTSVNIGTRNSLKTRIVEKNHAIFSMVVHAILYIMQLERQVRLSVRVVALI